MPQMTKERFEKLERDILTNGVDTPSLYLEQLQEMQLTQMDEIDRMRIVTLAKPLQDIYESRLDYSAAEICERMIIEHSPKDSILKQVIQ